MVAATVFLAFVPMTISFNSLRPSFCFEQNRRVTERPISKLHASQGQTSQTERVGYEVDAQGRSRLQFRDDGWSNWEWRGSKSAKGPFSINYIEAGEEGTPIVLIHGFGAHSYHWRYQIPALAKNHRVFSLCLLGYGWSPKAVVPYSGEVWGAQVADFG